MLNHPIPCNEFVTEQEQGRFVLIEIKGTKDNVWRELKAYVTRYPFAGYSTRIILPPVPVSTDSEQYMAKLERYASCD